MLACQLVLRQNAGKRNIAQIIINGMIQIFPQMVGQTRRTILAVGFAFAYGCVQLVFGGFNDLGDVDVVWRFAEYVAATWPAYAFHQTCAAQFAE